MLTPDLSVAIWHKSTRSSGASNCVEVAAGKTWRKSSQCNGATNCVEVAGGPAWAAMRDSKDPEGPALTMSVEAFSAFVDVVRTGLLDAAH